MLVWMCVMKFIQVKTFTMGLLLKDFWKLPIITKGLISSMILAILFYNN